MRNGSEVLPIDQRKTILILSDDLRMQSGVGTMTKEIVFGIIHRFNIIQIGGAIKHPDVNKIIDMSDSLKLETGVPDPNCKIYPVNGYGNQDLVRQIMTTDKPDAILHFTDPRFWGWLYQMEHEIRQNIPIFYYALWDDLPVPMYNKRFYESCDLIMAISKQYHYIHKSALLETDSKVIDMSINEVLNENHNDNDMETRISYVPHGINEHDFYPIDKDHEEWVEFQQFRKEVVNGMDIEFVVLYNSRNIRRKMTTDLIYGFKTFCDNLPPDKAKKCLLVLHTQPVDENGTDLPAVIGELADGDNITFSHNKLDVKHLNFLYNVGDVTTLVSSNEGFGLGTAESLMAGTPIIVNTTGGLQDQVGFKKDDGSYVSVKDYSNGWGSNHDGRYTKHGEWSKPIWPTNRAIVGSVPTPYIADDRCDWQDIAIRILEWYDTPEEDRKEAGLKGREYVMDDKIKMSAAEMCGGFIKYMDETFEEWMPRKRFTMFKVQNQKKKMKDNGLRLTKKIEAGNIYIPDCQN